MFADFILILAVITAIAVIIVSVIAIIAVIRHTTVVIIAVIVAFSKRITIVTAIIVTIAIISATIAITVITAIIITIAIVTQTIFGGAKLRSQLLSSFPPSPGALPRPSMPVMDGPSTGEPRTKRSRPAASAEQISQWENQLSSENQIMIKLFTAKATDLLEEERERVDEEFAKVDRRFVEAEGRLTTLENKQGSGSSGGSTTASGGTWVASHLDIKVCEYGDRTSQGIDIGTAKQWWQDISPHLEETIRQACGPVSARVPEKIYKFQLAVVPAHMAQARRDITRVMTEQNIQLSVRFPKNNVENSPDRIAKFQVMGALSDAVKAIAEPKGLAIKADWLNNMTVKVEKEGGREVMVGGVSSSGGVIWDDEGIIELGWTKAQLELNMRK